MPATFKENRGSGMLDPAQHTVKESVQEVTDTVNAALSSKLKYVTFTNNEDGKQFSVEARDVYEIREA